MKLFFKTKKIFYSKAGWSPIDDLFFLFFLFFISLLSMVIQLRNEYIPFFSSVLAKKERRKKRFNSCLPDVHIHRDS